jgi:hypothetical protein
MHHVEVVVGDAHHCPVPKQLERAVSDRVPIENCHTKAIHCEKREGRLSALGWVWTEALGARHDRRRAWVPGADEGGRAVDVTTAAHADELTVPGEPDLPRVAMGHRGIQMPLSIFYME